MSINSIRHLFRLTLVAALMVTTGSILDAQSPGDSFQPTAERTFSASSDRQKSEFNSLPFRAASRNRTNLFVKPPPQLTSTAAGASQLPNVAMRSAAPLGSANARHVAAQTASYGTSVTDSQSPLSSQELQTTTQLPEYLDMKNCSVQFIDDILLPAKEAGVIDSLSVKEGDYVPAGTIVGKIDDELYQRMLEQARLRYDIATEEAQDTTSIKAADKKYKVAAIEAKKISDLADKGSKSGSDRLMANYSKDIAELERDQAVRDREKAEMEKRLEAARFLEVQTHIEGHVLKSDFDAFVIKVIKKPQEYVRQGDEVMRIARMDRLWVQGSLQTTLVNADEALGRPVTVTVQRARGEVATFEGKITFVGLERQGANNYLVKAEVQNRPVGNHWVLHPMSNAQMRIHLNRSSPQDGSFESTAKSD